AFIYDLKTMQQLSSFTYQSEGWGITYNGEFFIVSDGTEKLVFYEPENFRKISEITVRGSDGKVAALNELEYINDEIYANVYQKDIIIRIDPYTGIVTGRLDFTDLVAEQKKTNKSAHELNGIAYNPETGNLFITGKNWDKIYEIKLNL
ncbi:MAG: glutaminyl-peptide cyclotransferase, partial [Calditrichaeota bacterium]|nr:glutaminyl-peptide cyclotransferase [Calditrichota bacterium]